MGLLDPTLDQIGPTPRNRLLGLLADAAAKADEYASAGPPGIKTPGAMISGLLGVPAIARTLDRMSYGLPVSQGAGLARQMLPDTKEAVLSVAPAVAKWPKQTAAVAAGLLGGGADAGAMKAATLFHGSRQPIDGLLKKSYGGVYLAENPAVAEGYAVGPDANVAKFNFDEKKLKVFDATNPKASRLLNRIEKEYDNATDYKSPHDGEYMPLSAWVKSGHLFDLGRKAQNEIMESLRAEGYDAVRYLDKSMMHDNSMSWVVFDPRHLSRLD